MQLANSLILCANIVNGPNHALSKDKLISAKRFLHHTSTLLPESKLCTGWLTTVVLDDKENVLTWPEVIEMLDALRQEKIDLSKVTFVVEAAVCAGSIPSIRWLLDVTGGSLIVHASAGVSAKVDHLLFIRKSLPADRVLYNVHNSLRSEFSAHPDSFPANKHENGKENNDEVHLNDWALLDVSDGEGNTIFQSKHVIVMQQGSVGTKLLYMLPNKLESADTQAVFSCKLEFVTTTEPSDKSLVRDSASLAKGVEFCFADPASSTKSQECGFVGMDGNFKIYKAGDAKPYAANKFTADEIAKRKNSRQQCFVVSFMYTRTKL
ncbi:MAG: DUF2181 domain-containing protein, partial [Candidatus Kapabacteria bacterium]|nr:DUF2181 domain-containing protein [Candidatus Kapabacteria bacterium]